MSIENAIKILKREGIKIPSQMEVFHEPDVDSVHGKLEENKEVIIAFFDGWTELRIIEFCSSCNGKGCIKCGFEGYFILKEKEVEL